MTSIAPPARSPVAAVPRRAPVIAVAALLVVTTTVAVALADRTPGLLADAGPAVRILGPAISGIGDLATATTIGALVMAAVVIPARSPAFVATMRVALVAAMVWPVTAVLGIVTAYADAAGAPPDSPGFGAGLQLFVTSFELGQYLLATALLAALTAVVVAAATGPSGAALAGITALVALVPLALSGHSGSAADHETATSSLGLHLLGLSVWVGGLFVLLVVGRKLGPDQLVVTQRFSGLALVASLLVAASGVLNASTRIDGLDQLGTRYGALVLVKVALVVVLLGAGAVHRRYTIGRLRDGDPRALGRLVVAELLVMAATIGVAVALSTTSPPVSDTFAPLTWSIAESVAGYPVPPAPDALRYVTGWQPDILWLLIAGAVLGGYLAGVRRLGRRGDGWPVSRTVAFTIGCVLLAWVTSGGPAVYGRWTFSGHMVQHMTFAMIVPAFLVWGAPLLLALRALRPRTDGSRGAREWLLLGVHSAPSRVLTHPIVAAALFTVGTVAFYYSPLFSLALRTHLGHELMTAHFLLSGYLFAWVLIGSDPGPRRIAHPFRLVVLLATMAFHAFFGVALLQGERLLAPEYWVAVAQGRDWGASPLLDQQLGASIAWGFGEIPTLVLALAVAVSWVRDDTRESRRKDRQADRDGDADLVAYNDMLTALADRPARDTMRR